jgi:hypothetical protein
METLAVAPILALIERGGVPALLVMGILFVAGLWRQERAERAALHEQLLARSVEHIKAVVQADIAARALRDELLKRGVIDQWKDPPNTTETRLPPTSGGS